MRKQLLYKAVIEKIASETEVKDEESNLCTLASKIALISWLESNCYRDSIDELIQIMNNDNSQAIMRYFLCLLQDVT